MLAPQQGQQAHCHQGKSPYFCPSACRKTICRFAENYFSDSQVLRCQNSRCSVHLEAGRKQTLGFVCALLIPGTLLSWQSWENQFLSGKIIPAAAISSCRISGESEGTVHVFHWPPWLFQPCASRGPCLNRNVPVHGLKNSLIPHLFGSRDSHTLFISGDPALRDAQEQRSSQRVPRSACDEPWKQAEMERRKP